MNQLSKRSFYGANKVLRFILVSTICAVASRMWIVGAFQRPASGTKKELSYTHYCYYNDEIKHPRRDPNTIWRVQDRRPPTCLYMAAGSRSLNKQAALRQKLEQAKQQKFEQQQNTTTTSSSSSGYPLSEKEIRERNDRLRFEELLQKKGGAFIDSENDMEYKSRQQVDDEIDAVRKCILFCVFITPYTSKSMLTVTFHTIYFTLFVLKDLDVTYFLKVIPHQPNVLKNWYPSKPKMRLD